MLTEPHIQRELQFPAAARFGNRNQAVKRLQEWLFLRGFKIEIDGEFGPATQEALRRFQVRLGQAGGGVLAPGDWDLLIEPLRAVCAPPTQVGFVARVRAVAQLHLKIHALEVGGPNSGPWVRAYMRGLEGVSQLWCAGFVSFVLRQAALSCTDVAAAPWRGFHEVSCDTLAAIGKQQGRFLSNAAATTLLAQQPRALDGSIFLLRKSANDWVHTGIATTVVLDGKARFDTVEGNTDEGGSNNGFEVARRTRSGASYDFIRLG
jgi:peptidoglycan hydrolase-like protein with peptidoglycan-binding domain